MRVQDIMTENVFSLRSDHRLDLVDDIMNFQAIRHIPIVDENERLVGLVTHRDLLKATISSLAEISESEQRDIYRGIPVSEVMTTDVVTVTPETTLRRAAAKMIEEKIGCLPVVKDHRLVGIITEADFLKLVWEQLDENFQLPANK